MVFPSFVIQTVVVKKVASGTVAEVSGCWDEAGTVMGYALCRPLIAARGVELHR